MSGFHPAILEAAIGEEFLTPAKSVAFQLLPDDSVPSANQPG